MAELPTGHDQRRGWEAQELHDMVFRHQTARIDMNDVRSIDTDKRY